MSGEEGHEIFWVLSIEFISFCSEGGAVWVVACMFV